MESDLYKTIAEPATSELRERASRFMGFAFPLVSLSDFSRYLNDVRSIHPKATHHCYAYRFGPDEHQYRANDDGEPSGSAGKPILGQIDSFGLSNVLIIVVRYYGGTKLGVPGLIQAYRDAARATLESAEIVDGYYCTRLKIIAEYPAIPDVMYVGKQYDWLIVDQLYTAAHQTLIVDVRKSVYPAIWEDLQTKAGGMYPDELREGKRSASVLVTPLEDHD